MTIHSMTMSWANPQREDTGMLGPTDILAVKLITGPAVPLKNLGRFTFGQFANVMVQACFSLVEGDFSTPVAKSPIGPTVTATEYFSLTGTNPPYSSYYPVLDPATTYYLNVKCAGADQPWGGFVELTKPK